MNLIVIPIPIALSPLIPFALAIPIGGLLRSCAARAVTACSLAECARANGAPSAVADVRDSRVMPARRDREVSS